MPLVERSLSMLLDLGLYEGDRFLEWIRERLEAKGVRTFADLVHDEFADDPRYRSRLQVIASDVTRTSCSCSRATRRSSGSSPTTSTSRSPCG